jgi:hypothetical protein
MWPLSAPFEQFLLALFIDLQADWFVHLLWLTVYDMSNKLICKAVP